MADVANDNNKIKFVGAEDLAAAVTDLWKAAKNAFATKGAGQTVASVETCESIVDELT